MALVLSEIAKSCTHNCILYTGAVDGGDGFGWPLSLGRLCSPASCSLTRFARGQIAYSSNAHVESQSGNLITFTLLMTDRPTDHPPRAAITTFSGPTREQPTPYLTHRRTSRHAWVGGSLLRLALSMDQVQIVQHNFQLI